MNIPELIQSYSRFALNERAMEKSSLKAIKSIVYRLSQFAHTQKIHELNSGIIREFLYQGKEKHNWSSKTFLIYRQYLNSFFAWCFQNQYITKNPIIDIQKPKLPKALPRYLTKSEVEKLLTQLALFKWKYEFERIRNETIIYTLLYAGLRLGELLRLKITDVNLSEEQILVRQGKGKKDRLVPIHSALLIRLRIYIQARKKKQNYSSWFFTGVRSEKPLSHKDVLRVCHKLSRASQVKFTPHRLRHTLGRLSIEANLSPYKLKEILGHSDISTTMIYSSASTKNIQESFGNLKII